MTDGHTSQLVEPPRAFKAKHRADRLRTAADIQPTDLALALLAIEARLDEIAALMRDR